MNIPKTNAMRILTQAKIPYTVKTYTVDENDLSGTKVAAQIGMPFEQVYKTLVARGDQTGHLVCLLPVDREIDLKRLAAVSGNKRVELIPAKDLLETTGYIRGGCSPVGMKRKFPSYIDSAAQNQLEIAVSAGIRGCQLIVEPQNLLKFLSAKFVEACHE